MINILMTRTNDDDGVYLRFPASPAEIGEAFAEMDSISTDTSATKLVETVSNVYNLSGYLKNVEVEKPGELEKLNTLARKLQTMDRESCFKFEGVLDANSVNGIDDVLRLSEVLDDYALIPDTGTGRTLGKFLVANGIVSFPESVQPYLDYQIIGEEYYAEHGGAFCRGGYVVRKDELPEQYLDAASEEKEIMSLRLRVMRDKTHEANELTLILPATEAQLALTKAKLGVEEFAEAQIVTVDYPLPYLATRIPQDCISVENANELALCIEQMSQSDGELLKYLSVLEVEQPETFQDALHYAMELDGYERVPADAGAYGRTVLERLGADEELICEIDGYMDLYSFGQDWMREDGVRQTEFGLVRKLSEPFPAEQQGMRME